MLSRSVLSDLHKVSNGSSPESREGLNPQFFTDEYDVYPALLTYHRAFDNDCIAADTPLVIAVCANTGDGTGQLPNSGNMVLQGMPFRIYWCCYLADTPQGAFQVAHYLVSTYDQYYLLWSKDYGCHPVTDAISAYHFTIKCDGIGSGDKHVSEESHSLCVEPFFAFQDRPAPGITLEGVDDLIAVSLLELFNYPDLINTNRVPASDSSTFRYHTHDRSQCPVSGWSKDGVHIHLLKPGDYPFGALLIKPPQFLVQISLINHTAPPKSQNYDTNIGPDISDSYHSHEGITKHDKITNKMTV